MPSTRRYYQLRIWDGTSDVSDFADPAIGTGNILVVSSKRDGENPYLADAPSGDGQELDPVTGKATIGECQVRIIDVETGDEGAALVEDTFEDGWAAIDARWPIVVTEGTETPTWGESTSPEDGTTAAFFTMSTDLSGATDEAALYEWSHTYGPADGLVAGGQYVVRAALQVNGLVSGGNHGMTVVGTTTETTFATTSAVEVYTFAVTADAAGEITVTGFLDTRGVGAFTRNVYFDNVRVYEAADYPGRIITSKLAATDAYWHLLSRYAAVEVSEDGATWATLALGFVNRLALVDALVWELTIGETRRAELRAELYRECPAPVLTDDVLVSPTCLIGGPIVGGADYNDPVEVFATVQDHGPARVEVVSQSGHSARQLDLDLVGAWMAPFWLGLRTTAGDGNDDVEMSYPNHHARQYFAWDDQTWAYDGGQQSTVYGSFPGLVAELTRVSDGETFYTVPLAAATRRSSSYLFKPNTNDPVGTYDNFITRGVEFRVDWDTATLGPKPSAGEQFDLRVWPARPSATFPIHERGHPVALILHHATAFDVRINAASATAAEAAINTKYGGTVVVELIHDDHLPFEKYHTELLAYFGYALRPTLTGELAFIGLRYAVPTATPAITLDLLRDADSTVYELSEESIVTTAETKTRTMLYTVARDGDDVEAAFEEFPPNLLLTAWHTATGATDDTVDAGDQRTHTWTLPGRVLVNGIPVDPDGPAQAAGDWLVDWKRRGVPTVELHVLPGVTADVGDEVSVDLPHFPVAVEGTYPVTQRGQAAVTCRVTRRTVLPEGADLALVVAPPADQATLGAPTGGAPSAPDSLTPEFTLTPWDGDPLRMVWITHTNASDYAGTNDVVAWEWYAELGAARIAGAFGPHDPEVLSEFLIGPAFPGATVCVRARTLGGAWTGYQCILLNTAAGDVVYADFGAGPEPVFADFGSGEVFTTAVFI